MSEWFTYGSVRGAAGNGGPYRDYSAQRYSYSYSESAGINRFEVENERVLQRNHSPIRWP
jgi:hypothetical protein